MGNRFFTTCLSIFAAGFLLSGLTWADHTIRWNQDISLEVVNDRGKVLSLYEHTTRRPNYRAYMRARKGQNYGLRIRNNGPNRIGLVIAIDGRNIISGKKSHLSPDERMYVLDPYSEGTYDGWRTNRNQVNRFYFTEEGASYAGAWGDHSAMGVIAVAVFPEQQRQAYEKNQPSMRMQAPGAQKAPGTGYGSKKYSPSTRVEFDPEGRASERYFIKYEWYKGLCKKGVIDCPKAKPRPKPRPQPPHQAKDFNPIVWDHQVAVDIIPDRGSPFTLYEHSSKRGLYRAYLQAESNGRYGIRVRNNSAGRVGLVIAVDGRNIISGKKSDLRSTEKMYVLDPHDESVYDGWRSGRNQVNRFFFTDEGGSYAGAWGDHSAMGVIAVAMFPEKVHSVRKPSSLAPAAHNLGRSGRKEPKLGTGYGEEEYSPSVVTHFTPQRHPVEQYFVKYEWRASLCRKGILRCERRKRQPPPENRFWTDDDDGFAPPPPNRYR